MRVFFAMLAVSLLSGAVLAQDPATQKPVQREENKANAEVSQFEKEIASIKLAATRHEVELATLAQQKSQNAQVKELAAKIIADHSEGVKDLEKWSAGYRIPAASRVAAAVKPADEPDAKDDGDKPGARLELQTKKGAVVGLDFNAADRDAQAGVAGDRSANWVSLHQEIANRCFAEAKKELNEKEGAEFDKCYIGMQVAAHQKAIIADEVLAKYVSAQAREKLEKCKRTETEHLEAAKSIMKSLESAAAAEVSKRQ
jgi:predicted outer membrane protein